MGASESKSQKHTNADDEPVLLVPSMEGNLSKVKELMGSYLATFEVHNVVGTHQQSENVTQNKIRNFIVGRADPQGNNAIHGAVFGGHLDVIKYLVQLCGGSQIDNDNAWWLKPSNQLGCHALWLAAGYNRCNVLEYIFSLKEQEEALISELLLQPNSTGDTPLIAAVSRGNADACQMLLDAEDKNGLVSSVETTNGNGDNPLHVAVACGHSKKVLDLLLDKTKNRKMHVLNACNKKGLTPLLVACERNDVEGLVKLLNHGADLEICDGENDNSAVALAAFCGNDDILHAIFEQQTTKAPTFINRPNGAGCTPLWLATRSGRLHIVQLLLEKGADPMIANKDGLSSLDCAKKYKRQEVLELLIKWQQGEIENKNNNNSNGKN